MSEQSDGQNPVTLLTCATFNYLDRLELLLASHHTSNPSIPLDVHAIGWPAAAVDAARQTYPHARFHPEPEPPDMNRTLHADPHQRSARVLQRKVELLHTVYHAGGTAPVLWVDADTLLLKPLIGLVNRISNQNGDFAVSYRPRKRPHARFAVAVLYFARTPAAGTLLDDYAARTGASAGLTKRGSADIPWFHDQLALWEAYRAHCPPCYAFWRRDQAPRMEPLTPQEHSIDGNTDAIFVSRRQHVLDTDRMREVLRSLGIAVPPILPASGSVR